MEVHPESDAAVAVLIGSFNPAIFQPAWLTATGLISVDDEADLDLGVLHRDLANFRTGWLTLNVQRHRLEAAVTDAAHFVTLRDFMVGLLTLLDHTPITACGINRHMQFRVTSADERRAIGHHLLPSAPYASLIEQPTLMTSTVSGVRPGSPWAIHLTVQPSAVVEPGIFMSLNEHYGAPTVNSASSARDTLRDNWETAMAHFLTCATLVLARARNAQ